MSRRVWGLFFLRYVLGLYAINDTWLPFCHVFVRALCEIGWSVRLGRCTMCIQRACCTGHACQQLSKWSKVSSKAPRTTAGEACSQMRASLHSPGYWRFLPVSWVWAFLVWAGVGAEDFSRARPGLGHWVLTRSFAYRVAPIVWTSKQKKTDTKE